MDNNFKRAALAALVLPLAACASYTPPTRTINVAPVQAKVTNYSAKTVASIGYQSCDANSDVYTTIPVGPLAPNTYVEFDLPAPCVNMQALYADGKRAGLQTGVRREFPFSWVIR